MEVDLNLEEILALGSQRPELQLFVNGKSLTFLCDTGACRTTCNREVPGLKPGTDVVTVRAANGQLTQVSVAEPVWIRDPEGESCQMPILYMPQCPVNLLGRDGMLQLVIGLLPSTNEQMVVKRRKDLQGKDLLVLQGHGPVYYWYSLDIPNKAPHCMGNAVIDVAKTMAPKQAKIMSPDRLHVTMFYKNAPGQDIAYEEKLHKACCC